MQVLWQESGWADYKILLPADVKWRNGTSLYNAVQNSVGRSFFVCGAASEGKGHMEPLRMEKMGTGKTCPQGLCCG